MTHPIVHNDEHAHTDATSRHARAHHDARTPAPEADPTATAFAAALAEHTLAESGARTGARSTPGVHPPATLRGAHTSASPAPERTAPTMSPLGTVVRTVLPSEVHDASSDSTGQLPARSRTATTSAAVPSAPLPGAGKLRTRTLESSSVAATTPRPAGPGEGAERPGARHTESPTPAEAMSAGHLAEKGHPGAAHLTEKDRAGAASMHGAGGTGAPGATAGSAAVPSAATPPSASVSAAAVKAGGRVENSAHDTSAPGPTTKDLPGVASQLLRVLSPPRPTPSGAAGLSVALHPAELGVVRATVTLDAGQLVVRLAPASPMAEAVIRQSLPDLQSGLHSDASAVTVLVVPSGSGGGDSTGSGGSAGSSPDAFTQAETPLGARTSAAQPDAARAPLPTSSLLDLRL